MALIEDASVTLAQFDTAVHHLGEQVHTLGPMSAVLLRTEATSSSQIEHLTVGAKNLAMELRPWSWAMYAPWSLHCD